MLSLKEKAKRLVSEWLGQYCRRRLSETLLANPVPCREEHLREAFLIGGALMNTDCREPRWHLLYIDTLFAKGKGAVYSIKESSVWAGRLFIPHQMC